MTKIYSSYVSLPGFQLNVQTGNIHHLWPALHIHLSRALEWRHNGRDGVLNHPRSRLFTKPFVQAQNIESTKAPRHWPLCGGFTGDRWILLTKGQWRGKCFHLMTSSRHAQLHPNRTVARWKGPLAYIGGTHLKTFCVHIHKHIVLGTNPFIARIIKCNVAINKSKLHDSFPDPQFCCYI